MATRYEINSGVTYDKVVEALSYDPRAGVFTWKKSRSGRCCDRQAGYLRVDKYGARRVIKIDGHAFNASRLAFLIMTGRWPNDFIDHRDGNSANDVWANLREATNGQNQANSRARASTGVKGVSRHKKTSFLARITRDGKETRLGIFKSLEEAAAAYREAASRLHGEFARYV